MQTKHLCVLIHLSVMCEVGTVKHDIKSSSDLFTDRSKVVLLLWICFGCLYCSCCLCCAVLPVSCSLMVNCWTRADHLLAIICVVFSCVCVTFPFLS